MVIAVAQGPAWTFAADTEAETGSRTVKLVTEIRRFRRWGLKPGQRVATRLTKRVTAVADHEEAVRSLARLSCPATFSATASLRSPCRAAR